MRSEDATLFASQQCSINISASAELVLLKVVEMFDFLKP